MFQRILVPLDGSELARRALPVAVELARQNNSTLVLAQAIHVSYGALPEAYIATPDLYNQIHDQAQADAETELKAAAGQATEAGVAVETVILEGDPASELVDYEDEGKIDLIVMSTHGRTGLARFVYGSVAERVLRHGSRPILLLRAHDLKTDAK